MKLLLSPNTHTLMDTHTHTQSSSCSTSPPCSSVTQRGRRAAEGQRGQGGYPSAVSVGSDMLKHSHMNRGSDPPQHTCSHTQPSPSTTTRPLSCRDMQSMQGYGYDVKKVVLLRNS